MLPGPPHSGAVELDEFAAQLERLGAPRRFAIAVSGGRDSMALALLAHAYAKKAGAEVFALTVDHGLRPDSDAQTAQCAAWCRALGLTHHAFLWRDEKPETGVQAAARAERYRLLAAAAVEAGCEALLTAHSADDQAETVFMRLARGAGAAGLSAMTSASMIAAGAGTPVRLLRPLLSFSRIRLTATADAVNQAYIDDPSNEDPAFERVRTRALLAALAEQDLLNGDALCRTARRLETAHRRLRLQEERLFSTLGGCFHHWGGASLDRAAETPAMGGLAARLVHAVNGEPYRPDDGAAMKALQAAHATGAATLGGVLIKAHRGRIWFLREPGALLGRAGVTAATPQPLTDPLLWDGRFILRPPFEGRAFTVAPLGEAAADRPEAALFAGPREGLMATPAIYHDDALIAACVFPSEKGGAFAFKSLMQERFDGEIVRF